MSRNVAVASAHVLQRDSCTKYAAPIARITLNRPEKRNPLGPTTIGELLHALDGAKSDESVRVIVLTGAGKVFSAGGDLLVDG